MPLGLTENLKIEDVTGRSMNGVDVYGAAIKYLKAKMLDKVGSEDYIKSIEAWTRYISMCENIDVADLCTDFSNITEDDIFWVFTEPAVSSFGVKSCIIEAAGKAGIQNEHVAVIPEPVATLVYGNQVPDEIFTGNVLPFESYTKYLIVDAGEQTVAISTYEVTDPSIFKELEVPVEYTVDPNAHYEDFLTEIIGKKTGGQRASSEDDIIVLVGQNDRIKLKQMSALRMKLSNKRLFIPLGYSNAVVDGAVLCCFTQLTVKK